LGFWWWPLSLAIKPHQPPFYGTLSRIPSSHHSLHFGFLAIMIYPL
jgi:hypothetical protein